MLLLLAGLAIADATSFPLRVTQGVQLHGGINPAGCATRIRNRVAPSRQRRTAVTRRFLPLAKIFRTACDSNISAGLSAWPCPSLIGHHTHAGEDARSLDHGSGFLAALPSSAASAVEKSAAESRERSPTGIRAQ